VVAHVDLIDPTSLNTYYTIDMADVAAGLD